MLQKDFFSFSAPQIEGNIVKTTIDINPSHKIFDGHFPGQPVVPGVCMVQIVKEVVESVAGKQTDLSIANNIKFLTIINPQINPQVELQYKFSIPEEGKIIIDAQLSKAPTTFFKMKASFIIK